MVVVYYLFIFLLKIVSVKQSNYQICLFLLLIHKLFSCGLFACYKSIVILFVFFNFKFKKNLKWYNKVVIHFTNKLLIVTYNMVTALRYDI